jgi:hypothetical protein
MIFSGPSPSTLDGSGWAADGKRLLGNTMNRRKVYWIGPRILDNYHTQTVEEPSDAQLAAFGKPNNPNISSSAYKNQAPGAWGPYKLVKMIPKAQLSSVLNTGPDSGTYKYSVEDAGDLVAFGFKYWYYVAAYDNESGEIAGKAYTTLDVGAVYHIGSSYNDGFGFLRMY